MTTETVSVQFVRYRDPEGRPTCARNFETGDVCTFFRVGGAFGKLELCAMAQEQRLEHRGDDPCGWLIPHDKCLLWKGPA